MAVRGETQDAKGGWQALVVATFVFTTTFWAWGLLAPLAPPTAICSS